MTEVSTPLPIRSPSGLIIQAGGQSSTEDKLSSHRRRETGLDGEPLESRHAVSRSIGKFGGTGGSGAVLVDLFDLTV